MDNRNTDRKNFALDKKGVVLMAVGLGLLIAGFILLAGGGVKDPRVFNYDMFNFQRMVLSPLVMVGGIVVIVVAIVKKN